MSRHAKHTLRCLRNDSTGRLVCRYDTTGKTAKRSRNNLDELARQMVGDSGSPNLFFVSVDGRVKGVFNSEKDARRYAGELRYDGSVLIEDRKQGEVWGNETYYRSQSSD
jgi:hypothetical protein